MRDRSGGRGIEPPAARDTAQPARESRDGMTQRLGRLPPQHPSSPRYREPTPSSGSGDSARAPGNAGPGAAPGRRGWPFSRRARDSQAGGGEQSGGPRGRRGAGSVAERPGEAGAGWGAPWRRDPGGQAGRSPDVRAERLAEWRRGGGSALPPLRRRSTAGSADRTHGDGKQRQGGQRDQPGYAAWRAQHQRNKRNQRGQGDQSAARGGSRSRKPPYRPWFASGGEGPPWFAEGSRTGDGFKP
jgi:hypothetical protein